MTDQASLVETPSLEDMQAREAEVHKLITKMGENAKLLLAKGMLMAVGYRIMVKPIVISDKLDGALADAAPTLAKAGFQDKTENERLRHERSEHRGVVLNLGPDAYKRFDSEPWCKEGDLVVFSRNAGTRIEHPPGSDSFFVAINDVDVFGVIV